MAFGEPGRSVVDDVHLAADKHEGKESTSILDKAVDEGRSLAQHQSVDDDVEITCFTEDVHDVILHFQIIRLQKQVKIVNFDCTWMNCRLQFVCMI